MSRIPSGSSRSRRPLAVLVVVAAIVVLAAAGGLAWLFGGGAPAAPSIDAGAMTAVPAASSDASAPAPEPAATGVPASSDGVASLDGTWTVDASFGSFDDFSGSWVGYRVKEELANIGATEAVGRTPAVTGTLEVAGGSLVSGAISVDLTTLVSDRPMRDGRVQDALGTADHPTAELTIDGPVALPAGLAAGETVTIELPATLAIHGTEVAVRLPVAARRTAGTVQIVGSLPVTFTGLGITPPSSFMVLSVADDAIIELQLFLTRG